MRCMNLKRIGSLTFSCLFTLFLCLPFLIVPFDKALAIQSDEEETAKLVEGAKKEGALLWYTSASLEEADLFIKGFQRKYPFIKAGAYRTGGDGLLNRILTEVRAKKYFFDVVKVGGYRNDILKREGLYAKYLSPERKFIPEFSKDPEGYWTAVYTNLNAIGYNTNLVSPQEAPKTWNDLRKVLGTSGGR